MKVDLHVHSKFSKHPAIWLLQKLGCAESYTDPVELYHIARRQGMDAVTITDHNSIAGSQAIAHLPNTFLSAEVTTYFPEDGCKLHVLVYDVTPAQFDQINAARENVFDLVTYLNQEQIFHVLAHPLYAVNDRLTADRFEQCLVMFKHLELNGDQEQRTNRALQALAAALTPEDIETLANRHGVEPLYPEPHVKGFTAGSDDHSSLSIASHYTEAAGAASLDAFWQTCRNAAAHPRCAKPGTPLTRAHMIYGVAYQFYIDKFALNGRHNHSVLLCFFDRMLRRRERPDQPTFFSWLYFQWKRRSTPHAPAKSASLLQVLQYQAERLVRRDPALAGVVDSPRLTEDRDQQWFRFVNQVSNDMLAHLSHSTVERLHHANPFDIFHTLGSTGALYTLLAPYFISYAMQAKGRAFTNEVMERIKPELGIRQEPRVGHFTDTFEEVNGVARTLNRHAQTAQKTGKHLMIVTCKNGATAPVKPGVKYFDPIDVFETPEYAQQKLFVPPFLEMLEFSNEQRFTHIHGATPGPIGLAALAVARIMRLPFYTTYHTAMPQYAQHLTGDSSIEDLMWRFMLWFYEQADIVFAPSQATAQELRGRGVNPDKIRIMPRGVNIEHFHPEPAAKEPRADGEVKFIYVGRVSREKNLPLLCRAFEQLVEQHRGARLVVVGDGPYRPEMERRLAQLPATFTGYLDGDELVATYNACDALVFPSTTDTFGNVVLEAQACGLPVIVSDKGGPCENVRQGETGLVTRADNVDDLVAAMAVLLIDPAMRAHMSAKARAYAETRSFADAFERYWQFYRAGLEDNQRQQPAAARTPAAKSPSAAPNVA